MFIKTVDGDIINLDYVSQIRMEVEDIMVVWNDGETVAVASGLTEAQCKEAMSIIAENLNASSFVTCINMDFVMGRVLA